MTVNKETKRQQKVLKDIESLEREIIRKRTTTKKIYMLYRENQKIIAEFGKKVQN